VAAIATYEIATALLVRSVRPHDPHPHETLLLEARARELISLYFVKGPSHPGSDSVRCLAAGGEPVDLEQVSALRGAD
jgi:hypothetical protein